MQNSNEIRNLEEEKNINAENSNENFFEECPEEVSPFTTLYNSFIRDPSISTECFWLISFLVSNKPGWRINTRQIINHKKKGMGRDKIYKAINEAIEAGYMKKEIIKKGNLSSVIKYHVSRTPKFKKSFRHPESQDPEFQYPENQDAKEKHNQEENKKGGGKTEPPPIVHNSKEKELFGKFVKLTQAEYQTLCDKYTKETVDFNIEKINQKLDARKIKPFEDYALRIESWIKDDTQKGITPKITKKSDVKESERNKKIADFIENKLFEGQMNSTRVYFQAGSQYALIRNIEKDVDIKYFYDKYECENFKNVLLEDCKRYINHNADSFIKGVKPSTINDLGMVGVNVPTEKFRSTQAICGGL